jgi:hypothetical protein
MNDLRTWVLLVVLAALVVGMVAYGRGPEHHHGNDVGALASTTAHADLVTPAARI